MDANTGEITTVAGNGEAGFSGDGGQATDASLNWPTGVDVDSEGHLYIADSMNHRVRVVDLNTGIIKTFAGEGCCFHGDGGQATNAGLNQPTDVAVDAANDVVYIADRFNQRVRSVDIGTGVIDTFAGNGNCCFSGDGGDRRDAELNQPVGLDLDSAGNLYIVQIFSPAVWMVDVNTDVITIVAGNGGSGFSGDGGPATDAQLNQPQDIALDSAGVLFISDATNNRIRRVESGNISTIAGSGEGGSIGDEGAAADAQLFRPMGVAIDPSNNLFISDTKNHRIRSVVGGDIHLFAGAFPPGFSGDGALATDALMNITTGVAVDGSGDLFIADRNNHRVRRVLVSSGIISTVAGNGNPDFSGDGGLATNAGLNLPVDVAFDPDGNIYIADLNNHRVRRVDVSTGIINTYAGNGTVGSSGDNGLAVDAQLDRPSRLAIDGSGNLFIHENGSRRIRKVDAETGIITTVAGNGTRGFSGDGGPATSASLNSNNITLDSAGNLYISEGSNRRIRRVDVESGIITTVVGSGDCCFSGDGGPATDASLSFPTGVVFDGDGNLFIADLGVNRIRRVDAVTGIITTIAGSGPLEWLDGGFSGDGGPATAATIASVNDIAMDPSGNLLIADTHNHVVRKVAGVGEAGSSAEIVTVTGEGEAMVGDQFFVAVSAPGATAVTTANPGEPFVPIDEVPEILVRMHGLESVRGEATTHVWLGEVTDGPTGLRDIGVVVDGEGGEQTLTARLNVVGTRSNRNFFLMPGSGFVGLSLVPDDAGIENLLTQPVGNASAAFEAELGGEVTLADIVQTVFAFSDGGEFLAFHTADPILGGDPPASTLNDLAPYQGMIIRSRSSVVPDGGGDPIDVFDMVAVDGFGPQAVPIKMTVHGPFLNVDADGPLAPVTETLRFEWNLVAPHINEEATFDEVFSNAVNPVRLTSNAISLKRAVMAVRDSGHIVVDMVEKFLTVSSDDRMEPELSYWVFISKADDVDEPVVTPQSEAGLIAESAP